LKELARLLPEHKVVLIDQQEDAGSDAENVVNACGATRRFGEAAALLGRCELSIVQDTGLAHACGALGLRSLALVGSIPPEARFSTYGGFSWIHPADRVECCPCWDWQERWTPRQRSEIPARGLLKSCHRDRSAKCLEAITPGEIALKAKQMIEQE
jgi:ADP-heptose:LPS heptosyltransferase